jgi:hypothetical protein
MVADPAEAPLLQGIEARAPGRVVIIEPRLDMTAAMGELARAEGKDSPAKSCRIHLAALAAAAGVKNAEAAQGAADQALRIARERGWPDREVVVHMAMAATRRAAGEHDLAIRSDRSTCRAAEPAAEVNHPAAPKLRKPRSTPGGIEMVSCCPICISLSPWSPRIADQRPVSGMKTSTVL